MTTLRSSNAVERFGKTVAERLGLYFDESKARLLEGVLESRLRATRQGCDDYLRSLQGTGFTEERAALAQELTVTETYFFRSPDQIAAFVAAVRLRQKRPSAAFSPLCVLSLGCASGEELYSLAMALRENLPELQPAAVLRGVDINRQALERARRGRYSAWSLRQTPAHMVTRFFSQSAAGYDLDAGIRASVSFEEGNLADASAEFWQPGAAAVIFCRNVLMYFEPQRARKVLSCIARAIEPGGYLFLGHAETLRGLSHDFELCHTHDTFYYQLRAQAGPGSVSTRDASSHEQRFSPPEIWTSALSSSSNWVDTIRLASERVAKLAASAPNLHAENQAKIADPSTPPRALDLEPARELLRKERFTDAIALLSALPDASAEDADVLLLRAALLTHSGALTQAAKVCQVLLQFDDLNAGAHYLLALCREGSGDPIGAIDHDQIAAYLDPQFAMPRLHLGLLARRRGDKARARRELSLAFMLLERENSARLLLFGGGFNRDALLSLCRAELLASGGKP